MQPDTEKNENVQKIDFKVMPHIYLMDLRFFLAQKVRYSLCEHSETKIT